MAFVVEDETGLADANAYITVQEYKDYHADRGNSTSGTATALQQAIVKATDYMEQRWGQSFLGNKEFKETQALSFPRINLFDRDGVLVVGLPTKLKNACAEYAALALTQALFLTVPPDATGLQVTLEKNKVGPIEIEKRFDAGEVTSNTVKYPEADKWLAEYILTGGHAIR